jgi:acyl-CoA thioester hydrolase
MSSTSLRSRFRNYAYALTITTRWHDNDVYGHVNNVQYYAFFDTAVNRYLIEHNVLDIHRGEVIGLVVETSCRYFAPIAFPDLVVAAVRVDHLGNSSVRYAIGLFQVAEAATKAGAAGETPSAPELRAQGPIELLDPATEAVAEGHFVHVYVDRHTRRPRPLPDALREALGGLRIKGH